MMTCKECGAGYDPAQKLDIAPAPGGEGVLCKLPCGHELILPVNRACPGDPPAVQLRELTKARLRLARNYAVSAVATLGGMHAIDEKAEEMREVFCGNEPPFGFAELRQGVAKTIDRAIEQLDTAAGLLDTEAAPGAEASQSGSMLTRMDVARIRTSISVLQAVTRPMDEDERIALDDVCELLAAVVEGVRVR